MYQAPPGYPQPPQPRRMSACMIVFLVLAGCGVVGVAGLAILGAIVFPVFAQAREAARKANCMSNVRRASMALQMYAQDWGESLPSTGTWQTDASPYEKPVIAFTCPSRKDVAAAYAYNSLLNRRSLAQISQPSQTPMVFEASLNRPNAADKLQSFVRPHRNTGIVAFVDGHVLAMTAPPHATAGLPRKGGKH